MNENNVNNVSSTSNDRKGIFFAGVGILTIIVAIAGATFAWFQASVSDSEKIGGESAYGANNLTLLVEKKAPAGDDYATRRLIPQKSTVINRAVVGEGNNCIDGNGNAVCQVYKITITNASDSTMTGLVGSLQLTLDDGLTNLKWKVGTKKNDAPDESVIGNMDFSISDVKSASTTSVNFEDGTLSLAGEASKTYWLVFWIEEKNAAQTDSGTFEGTVTFSTGSSGVTSTIE